MTSDLDVIRYKLDTGERLSVEDGLVCLKTDDLFGLGELANRVRESKHGNKAYYVLNRHINYSNVCAVTCLFCAFARRKGQEGGYTFDLEEIFEKAEELNLYRGTELHIVGGLHPDHPFAFYVDMLRGIKDRVPGVHVKAFTAVEIDYLAEISGQTIAETLAALRDAGLDSLPGGGAEIFAEPTRGKICRTKTDAVRWLDIHRTAHKMGIRSTCTMLFGHIESHEDRVDHLLRLRELQDETNGFTAFIPLLFHPANTFLDHLPGPTGLDTMRVFATARLLLDNIEHVKAYWIMTTLPLAQTLLHWGADDMDGTIVEEKIYHMAGAATPQGLPEGELQRAIREAGREPVRRDSLYRPLETVATA